jgi:hypothetical protein
MVESKERLAITDPISRRLYKDLLAAVKPIGPFREAVKKTSIHLVRRSAFAGVHPRKEHLLITIKAQERINSARLFKAEQVSKNRWHLDVKLATSQDIDAELLGWLRQAYELCQ